MFDWSFVRNKPVGRLRIRHLGIGKTSRVWCSSVNGVVFSYHQLPKMVVARHLVTVLTLPATEEMCTCRAISNSVDSCVNSTQSFLAFIANRLNTAIT